MWIAKALLQKTLAGIPGGVNINHHLQNINVSSWKKIAEQRTPGLLEFISRVNNVYPIKGATVFETGTGWNAINALLLRLMGAKLVIATDHLAHLRPVPFRQTTMGLAANAALIAKVSGQTEAQVVNEINDIAAGEDLADMLHRARIDYRAPFDAVDSRLPDQSIDIHYSYAVLAHLPEELLSGFAQETARIVKRGGIAAHAIGLQDPFNRTNGGKNLNFLRYSEATWSFLSHNSIQYNNRVRASQHVRNFVVTGGSVADRWETVLDEDVIFIKNSVLGEKFDGLSVEDLATIKLNVILKYT